MNAGTSPPRRRILANLDCESDFASAAGRSGSVLPRRVLATIAGAATLLRAFARDGDRLWVPTELEPATMAEVPGLPRPRLESGPPADLEPAEEVLAWGETAEVARQRSRPRTWTSGSDELPDLLWHLPAPSPPAAAAVNHRAFGLALADELGCRLPGARMIASPRQLTSHLAAGGAAAAAGSWVLKAPFSAAGRSRFIHRDGAPAAAAEHRIQRLFARHGALLFEPWMDRTADFGVAAAITPEGTLRFGAHRLLVDQHGRFSGIELRLGGREPGLDEKERQALDRTLEGVARALRDGGYSGPFGIDFWRYRRADGSQALHPLGEINGRMTFGLVARALIRRLRGPLGLNAGTGIRLILGRHYPTDPNHATVQLFEASRPTPRAIWLEIL